MVYVIYQSVDHPDQVACSVDYDTSFESESFD